MPRVQRVLRWFHRDNDELVGEELLRAADLRELRRVFGVPANDPMYECFEVGVDQKPTVQRSVSHRIRLDRYAYFVEADAVPAASAAASNRKAG